jgi:hypothetical protein
MARRSANYSAFVGHVVGWSMSRRKVISICLTCLLLLGAGLIFLGPPLWVREGMTYQEVEAVLGKQLNGMRPVMFDGTWTGLWPGVGGNVEVTFDENNRVRAAPRRLHCFVTRLFCIGRRPT